MEAHGTDCNVTTEPILNFSMFHFSSFFSLVSSFCFRLIVSNDFLMLSISFYAPLSLLFAMYASKDFFYSFVSIIFGNFASDESFSFFLFIFPLFRLFVCPFPCWLCF